MSVVFPKPLSPFNVKINTTSPLLTHYARKLTNNHDREVCALLGHDLVLLKSLKRDKSVEYSYKTLKNGHLVGKVSDTDTSGQWGRHVLRREECEGVT
jgi:hypothetical protein